jgi:lipopolysaccharide export system permease protein
MKLSQLLISMKQKSPELEIPEGVFYDGIPNSNIYVQKKDLKSGKLYGIMIYRMTQSYEDAAIILADSGMMQSTAEKKHLILKLWSGEWFENMRSDELGNSAAVPYRRETFTYKKIVLDFDGDFNLTDAAALSNNAQGKSLAKIRNDLDSINLVYDSIGRNYLRDLNMLYYNIPHTERRDSLKALQLAYTKGYNIDSIFGKLSTEQKQQTVASALAKAQNEMSDLEFKSLLTSDGDKNIRRHRIEMVNKFTVALSCLIFFFIGAPLGAIIRKGGLGVPVIISVLVFIIYYILDNSGFRMAREGIWAIWFGKGLAPGVLTPIAIFVTYKANKDSVVFNVDVYRNLLMKALGLRLKRHIPSKEVIIEEPNYQADALQLQKISQQIAEYNTVHRLKKAPNPIRVFFKYKPDHAIEMINEELEKIIENLANTKDQQILRYINQYPIMAVKAHTRPFEKKWKNIIAAIIIPAGLFFYMRMWRFRLRLLRDLKITSKTNEQVIARIQEM